jgi:hypothetical protein
MVRDAHDSRGDVLFWIVFGASEFRAHGDTATASRLLKKARDWMAAHPVATPLPARQYSEGRTLFSSRMPDSAAVRFASVASIAHDPAQKEAAGYLALTYLARGDRGRARAVADSLGRLSHPSIVEEFWRAAIVGALGDRAQAVQLLRKLNAGGTGMEQWHSDLALESLYRYPEFEELVRPKR